MVLASAKGYFHKFSVGMALSRKYMERCAFFGRFHDLALIGSQSSLLFQLQLFLFYLFLSIYDFGSDIIVFLSLF
jgi:hypothetical protein